MKMGRACSNGIGTKIVEGGGASVSCFHFIVTWNFFMTPRTELNVIMDIFNTSAS